MATYDSKRRVAEDDPVGLGRYKAERDDLWGQVTRNAATGGMSSLTNADFHEPGMPAPVAAQTPVSTGSGGDYSRSGPATPNSFDPNSSGMGGLGLPSWMASATGTGTSFLLGGMGVPGSGTLGSIAGAVLGDKTDSEIKETAGNGLLGTALSTLNPIAGLIYNVAKGFGLNVVQGVSELADKPNTETNGGHAGGFWGKKSDYNGYEPGGRNEFGSVNLALIPRGDDPGGEDKQYHPISTDTEGLKAITDVVNRSTPVSPEPSATPEPLPTPKATPAPTPVINHSWSSTGGYSSDGSTSNGSGMSGGTGGAF